MNDYIEVESTNYLYGWSDNGKYIGPDEYKGVSPEYDSSTNYIFNSHTGVINKIDTTDNKVDIKFNCIIPLYDVININHTQNLDEINNLTEIDCNGQHAYVTNVPLGIWFANEDKILTRAGNTNYAPSWSLVLSSQFKPFPYSATKVSEIDQSDRLDAFNTFAQILVRQNKMLDKISTINTTINGISNRLSNLEANVNSVGTSYNIDGLHTELISLRSNLTYELVGISKNLETLTNTVDDITSRRAAKRRTNQLVKN